MESRVLALLLLGATASVESAATGWRAALQLGRDGDAADGSEHSQQAPGRDDAEARRLLLDAVDAIIPYLPEYNDLSPRIEGLLEFCRSEYSAETDRMLRTWFERRPEVFVTETSGTTSCRSSSAFRAWLLQWFSQSTHVPSSSDTERSKLWRDALRSALLGEQQVDLRRSLVTLLHRLDPNDAIDDQESQLLSASTDTGREPKLSSAEELLDFYWIRSRELAPFALLCAVKLHALTSTDVSTNASNTGNSSFVQLSGGVQVRLRWYSLLEPLFFRPFVSHCVALQVFQPGVEFDDALHVHDVVRGQLESARWLKRSALVLEHLSAEKRRLLEACSTGAVHVGHAATKKSAMWNEEVRCPEFLALSEKQQRLVLEDLECDLEDAPAPLFQRILVSFGAVVSTILSSAVSQHDVQDNYKENVELATMRSLFALFDVRGDAENCFSIAALVMSLQLPQHPIWTRSPGLFTEIVESLNEQLALESMKEKRWVLRMMLQQLLFESEPAVVQRCLVTLHSFLPPRLHRLAALRLP